MAQVPRRAGFSLVPHRRSRIAARRQGAAAAVVAAALCAGALAGCSASSTVDPVASAAEATQSVPGVRFAISGEISSAALPRPLQLSGGGYLTKAQQARLQLTVGGLPHRVAGGRLSIELRKIGDAIFLRLPLGKKLNGRSWISFDERRTAKAEGLEGLPSTDELDPDQYLTYLRSVSGGLAPLGSQVIRGMRTNGYRGEIKLRDVAAKAPGDRRKQTEAAIANLEQVTGITGIPFQVWIDDSHHVRRLSIALGETRAEGASIYITIDYLSFARQPPVTAPPASQVLDRTQAAMKQLRRARRGTSAGTVQ